MRRGVPVRHPGSKGNSHRVEWLIAVFVTEDAHVKAVLGLDVGVILPHGTGTTGQTPAREARFALWCGQMVGAGFGVIGTR